MERNLNLSSLRTYLAFPVQDREAVNRFLVGAALYVAGSIIPILPLIPALGYQYQVMQRVIEGEGPGMPAWEDWGRLFKDGLKLLLIGGVYMLPGILAYFIGIAIYTVSILSMMGAGNHPSTAQVVGYLIGLGIMFVGLILGMILFLLGSLPLPIAAAHAVAQDRVSAAFQVKAWWPILRRSAGDFVIAWIVFYGLAVLLYFAYMLLYMTIILCLALPLILGAFSFYMLLVGSAMFAAIYRQAAPGADELHPLPPSAPINGRIIASQMAAAPITPETPASPDLPDPAGDLNATRLLPRSEGELS